MDKDKWKPSAYRAFIEVAREETKPFTAEQIRLKIGDSIDQPNDLRWWGEGILALKAGGFLRRVSFAPAVSSHGSLKPQYRIK